MSPDYSYTNFDADRNAGGIFEDDSLFGRDESARENANVQNAANNHATPGFADADWFLNLCEGDGFSLQMLNEMMRVDGGSGGGVFEVGG